MSTLRLGLNVDHVATLRNARGGALPDPVEAARMAIAAGADGLTAHLRPGVARSRVGSNLLREHPQQRNLELRGVYAPLRFESADEPARASRVECPGPALQRDHIIQAMRLAASPGPANPEHRPFRRGQILVQDSPRALGCAGEHKACYCFDSRRGLQFQPPER